MVGVGVVVSERVWEWVKGDTEVGGQQRVYVGRSRRQAEAVSEGSVVSNDPSGPCAAWKQGSERSSAFGGAASQAVAPSHHHSRLHRHFTQRRICAELSLELLSILSVKLSQSCCDAMAMLGLDGMSSPPPPLSLTSPCDLPYRIRQLRL
ncbi:uncharacterized protein BDR25DRAFT_83885 [Lindgomyces ingoldianus]|uniref:Uncharacterized protein n=1 Tax=Lindgomyces ingoldianus TaxID=673940 RepID=A0ACB6QH21_9PLEO|nr:uncharacterized protein BDR25DRAFT_83885 [Lindgomyces ingoldianus]KAF2465441.1 hypothetical protein BDR25DRAFT_83885 [Lindgomyces ingoldianus]